MNYTPEMEKAMQQRHGFSYAEYSRKLEIRIKIEKRRQKEYEASKHAAAEIDSHIYK